MLNRHRHGLPFALILVVALVATMLLAVGSAGASPSGLQGRFAGIDVERIPVGGSYWEITFTQSGRWQSIDSSTNVCWKHRSRLWGEFWETHTPNTYGWTYWVKCLEGPREGMVFGPYEPSIPLVYDPVEDTVLQETGIVDPSYRDVVFCRIPCDPYDYYRGPY